MNNGDLRFRKVTPKVGRKDGSMGQDRTKDSISGHVKELSTAFSQSLHLTYE